MTPAALAGAAAERGRFWPEQAGAVLELLGQGRAERSGAPAPGLRSCSPHAPLLGAEPAASVFTTARARATAGTLPEPVTCAE